MRSDKERIYDAYLAAAARTGDRGALSILAKRWHPKLLRHAWRLTGDPDMAADIVQDAWIDILKGIRGLRNTQAFAAWAFRVVTRRTTRSYERRQRRQETAEAYARQDENVPIEPDRNECLSDLEKVQKLIAELPPKQRAAIGLFYLEDLRVAEVSVALGVPPGTIKTRLMHARARLRELIEGERNE